MNVRKEIELAIKKENPNWDGKTFDYGCSIYQNALECYEAIEPIIENAGHSGLSYSIFASIMTRILNDLPLTPITEEDFNEEFPEEMMLGDTTDQDGSITRQCVRYGSLFRTIKPDGTKTYRDVERVVVIDQYGMSWQSGWTERLCSKYIPPLTLPYMPSEKKIKIYSWQFSWEKDKGFFKEYGSYNSEYIEKIVFPNGEVKHIGKLYLDDSPTEMSEELFQELKSFIDKDVRQNKRQEK